ncbi:MAG: ABC transporter substrate-binding protein [Synergistaceae bacterium]|jgi:iron complex transport system substrate-binding protein|nr:ABC transporter substrate-binding protein [Synergistaceae bacterium]
MNNTRFSRIFALFLILLLLLAAPTSSAAAANPAALSKTPSRILSLSPAATEILFDLGLGDKIVGVTEYCSWPPEARSKKNIGDMMHVNMEVVVALKPDIVIISNMNEHLKSQIESLGFPVVVVYQDDFNQICGSMKQVGEACGAAESAKARIGELRGLVSGIAERASGETGRTKRSVLVVVGRDAADTSFNKVYVTGPLSFYNDLLTEAGAINVFTRSAPYANISKEGLLRLDPDIIIELVGEHGMTNVTTPEIIAQWNKLTDLKAAREGNVAIIRGDFTMRAGPRYPLLLEAFSKVINEGAREIWE